VKQKILIYFSLMMLMPVANADLAQAIDPWGNYRKAGELRAKRDELNQLRANQEKLLADELKQLEFVTREVSERKSRFDALKSKVTSVLSTDNNLLANLVTQQTEQYERSAATLNRAKEVRNQVHTAMVALTVLQSQSLAIRILEPIFANNEANRQIWMLALNEVERQPGLKREDIIAIAALRKEIDAANDWFWRRPGVLMNSFTGAMSELSRAAGRALLNQLQSDTENLIQGLTQEMEIQKNLVVAIEKMKRDHDNMRRALNP